VQVPNSGKRLCGCGTWLFDKGDEGGFDLVHDGDQAAAERLSLGCRRLLTECSKAIVGQREVLEQIVLALISRGHCLLVGVPGLAKTLMIRTVADALALSFNRIQFTPDLMPTDITGTEVLQIDRSTGERAFQFIKGPLFANVVLADEINRTPPRTQAALLEAMQERQVTAGGHKHKLPDPFFVLATQNPIEQEGTYPLPEAQQDRFMFNVVVDYPNSDEEYDIVRTTTSGPAVQVDRVVDAAELVEMQELVRKVPVAPFVAKYALNLARATRPKEPAVPDFVKQYVTWGAGPRASQFLVLAAKARAVLHGRPCAATVDVQAVAAPVLRHRVILNYNAEADGVTPDELVRRLLTAINVQ
jgi:MoxR-like ATPase